MDIHSSSGAVVCFSRIFFFFFTELFLFFCVPWAILNRKNFLLITKTKKTKTKKNSSKMFSCQIKILNICTVARMTRVTSMACTVARMARWIADSADPFFTQSRRKNKMRRRKIKLRSPPNLKTSAKFPSA